MRTLEAIRDDLNRDREVARECGDAFDRYRGETESEADMRAVAKHVSRHPPAVAIARCDEMEALCAEVERARQSIAQVRNLVTLWSKGFGSGYRFTFATELLQAIAPSNDAKDGLE